MAGSSRILRADNAPLDNREDREVVFVANGQALGLRQNGNLFFFGRGDRLDVFFNFANFRANAG